ncbi:hypothetical protein GCM10027047_10670 [Rhodococcus aerolatus]
MSPTAPARVLLAAGVAAQVAYPLTQGAARDRVSVAVVVLLAAACTAHAGATRGARAAVGLLAVTAGVGLLVELVGTRTGVPFGCYAYAPGRLGPEVAGVPLVIAAAWTTGAWPAWCAARRVVARRGPRVLLAATGLAAWDLYLDPQMVADGRWRFCGGGATLPGPAGVPLTNLAGWVVVALVMAAGLAALDHHRPTPPADAVPVALLLWTWLGSGLAHLVFLDLPVSGVLGLLGMGVLGVPLLVALRRERVARAEPAGPPVTARAP